MLAIITARGGSKGLPGKNIKELNGHPLIAYTIMAAKKSAIFQKILVSTDCTEIAEVSRRYGADVDMRPKELASDIASSYDVVEYILGKYPFEAFMLLQPTSPLRTEKHIRDAFEIYQTGEYASVVSVVETEITPYKCLLEDSDNKITPLFDWDYLTKPRQELPQTYLVNGAIYLCDSISFIENKSFFSQKMGVYKMDRISSIDIDNLDDFLNVERNMLKH